MVRKNIFLAENKKNGEGKGGKYIFLEEKINGERKGGEYLGRKIYFFQSPKKRSRKRREIFGEGNYIFCGGEDKRRR